MSTSTVSPDQLLRSLRWRYAVKRFDPKRKIAPEVWGALEEALVLTASSYGLQPWKFLVIEDKELRESLVPHSWGQRQVADCSHLVVMAVLRAISTEDIDRHVKNAAAVRGMNVEMLARYRDIMIQDVVSGPRADMAMEWAARQAYIALGNFMTSAALLGVDTCPMEGFLAHKYDEILGLDARGLTTCVLCPAGYRDASDKYAGVPKVRFPKETVVEYR